MLITPPPAPRARPAERSMLVRLMPGMLLLLVAAHASAQPQRQPKPDLARPAAVEQARAAALSARRAHSFLDDVELLVQRGRGTGLAGADDSGLSIRPGAYRAKGPGRPPGQQHPPVLQPLASSDTGTRNKPIVPHLANKPCDTAGSGQCADAGPWKIANPATALETWSGQRPSVGIAASGAMATGPF